MEATADEVSGYMKLLASPSRLMILCQLVESERSVGELCELVGMKPPAMSQHLARLRQEGVLATRREAQTIYYAIVDPNTSSIMMFLYETFCGPDTERKSTRKPSSKRSKRHA
ncbi:MAG: metalloregulator ArsR/SmtB family transcription factor [Pseudomonadota bacterium]